MSHEEYNAEEVLAHISVMESSQKTSPSEFLIQEKTKEDEGKSCKKTTPLSKEKMQCIFHTQGNSYEISESDDLLLMGFLLFLVMNVLTWKSPVISGVILISVLVVIYILFYSRLSLVSLMAYAFLGAIILNFLYVTATMVFASIQNQDIVNPNK
jgi:hypothetical protein